MVLLRYSGSNWLRQRLILSTLSGRPIFVSNIRINPEGPDKQVGLRDYEASLLRLLDKITRGSVVQINETGTALAYRPGVITGGAHLVHECATSRGLGYYLEVLLALAPFGKKPLAIVLKGVTNHPRDMSVDMIRNCTLHLVNSKFKISEEQGEEATLQVIRRGAYPLGGGEIKFTCPIVKRQLSPVQLTDEGMIKRIRGIAFSTRVAPAIGNRIVESGKGICHQFIPDVWIFTDHYTGKQSGNSPGYALFLQAETTTHCRLSVEVTGDQGIVPEDLAKQATHLLFEEIKRGGCVDSSHQWLVLLFMALTPEDVSKVRLGKLTEYSIQYLRHIHEMLNVTFKIVPDMESKTVLLSCVGSGYRNVARKSS